MNTPLNRISHEAVKKATGKTWEEWVLKLNALGCAKMSHKEIAELVQQKFKLNGWWSQMVTVGYEYAQGKRVVGKTADAGFQLGVTKTLPIAQKDAWRLITSSKGIDTWLGTLTKRLFLKPGVKYQTKDGISGEIRTIKQGERIRLTWQPTDFKKLTTLQVTVIPRKSTRGTCISFHHEKLGSAKERNLMRQHWRLVLKKLAQAESKL